MRRYMNRFNPPIVGAAMFILTITLATPGSAADIYVNRTADLYNGNCFIQCSLRDAILVSNANGEADTIHVPAGHYNLTIPNGALSSETTGDLNIDSPDAVTIIGEGPGVTVVDGNAIDRVFRIASTNGTVTLQGMTITGGNPAGSGGGIFNWDAILIINSCEITGNHVTDGARDGGGIFQEEGVLWLNDSMIANNSSAGNGGGVYVGSAATAEFNRCAIYNNIATLAGGAAEAEGTTYFHNVTFFDNDAGGSADSVLVEGTSEFVHCTFVHGLASEEAIFARAGGAHAILKNSIIGGACNVESGTIDAVAGNVEYGDTCLMGYGNYPGAGVAAGLGSMSDFGFNGGGVPTQKLQVGSVSHDYVFTDAHLMDEDARSSDRPIGPYGDSGAFEAVPDEIFSHGFENRYTTGWSSTVQ